MLLPALKEDIDKLNGAESFAYQMKGMCDDEQMKDKLTEDQKTQIKKDADAILEATKAKDVTKATSLQESLQKYVQDISLPEAYWLDIHSHSVRMICQ